MLDATARGGANADETSIAGSRPRAAFSHGGDALGGATDELSIAGAATSIPGRIPAPPATTVASVAPRSVMPRGKTDESRSTTRREPSGPDEARPVELAPASFPAEEAFAAGWAALREGEHGEAALRFAAAAVDPGSSIAPDAAYWEIVSLARAGESSGAEAGMRRFLERHPTSERAGEVSLMLGLRLAARGDGSTSTRLLQKAAEDPNPRVREAAAQALARLE